MVDDIYFWGRRSRGRVDGTYWFLSNFYRSPFTLHGKRYETVEHYYQSMKHRGTDLEEKIRTAKTARDAKRLAWSRDPPCKLGADKRESDVRGIAR